MFTAWYSSHLLSQTDLRRLVHKLSEAAVPIPRTCLCVRNTSVGLLRQQEVHERSPLNSQNRRTGHSRTGAQWQHRADLVQQAIYSVRGPTAVTIVVKKDSQTTVTPRLNSYFRTGWPFSVLLVAVTMLAASSPLPRVQPSADN